MNITAVDDKKDLFLVENILPADIIHEIQQQDFSVYPWELQQGQENWRRRKLLPPADSCLHKIDPYLNSVRLEIADILNVAFTRTFCWSSFWYDSVGFTTDMHLDGSLPIAMQLYLKSGPENLGTVFYHSNAVPWKIRYKFPYRANTGYIMLNNPDQWHAVPSVLGPGQERLSSYTYFGNYNHK